jgi:ferritin
VEEEENVGGVLEQLKLMGEAKGGLFMMDRELAKRSAGGGAEEAD